jgi:hypothetical protein
MVYPNPVTGPGPLNILLPLATTSDVEIGIFTTSFRKIAETRFPNVAPGQILGLPLLDHGGSPLANGLYYLFIRVQGHIWKVKLLVLR